MKKRGVINEYRAKVGYRYSLFYSFDIESMSLVFTFLYNSGSERLPRVTTKGEASI